MRINTLEWEPTAHDPAVLTEPWQLATRVAKATDIDDSHPTNPR